MDNKLVIKVENVNKTFKLPHEKTSSLKSLVVNFYRRKKTFEKQHVLKNINFEIKKGEFFGIVGRNGSGKSTLLKLLAGIYEPDKGQIHINGSLTPFIELGVGFNPELTGRENVFLNGALLGFNRAEMNRMYKDIVEFAELERFMDQKLKNYSSGMQVRLAFSIAIRAHSDILLIDEVLAVGDAAFQAKCFNHFTTLKKNGNTVILVSHDRNSLQRFCENGIFINNGVIEDAGPINKILASYNEVVLEELETTKDINAGSSQKISHQKTVTIRETRVLNHGGKQQTRFKISDSIHIEFTAKVHETITNPIFGVTVWHREINKPIYATNTTIEHKNPTGIFKQGEQIIFKVELPTNLNEGEYQVEPAVADEAGTAFYDQKQNAARFFISGGNNPFSTLSENNSIVLKRKS